MKSLLCLCLTLAAVLVQPGCNRDTGPDAVAAAKTKGTQSRGFGIFGTTKPPSVTLPAGTQLSVRTTTTLSTNSQASGQTFTAHLEQPLLHEGREIAPKGAEVDGQIVDSDKGGRVKDRASLAVQLTGLDSHSGQVEISTNTITREARATKKKDAVKIGIGSGVGAAIGAIAGGGRGAAIGAAAGAGAGTGVVLATHGDPAVIPSETVLHFALRAPVTIGGR
jgi:hypothetical protein